MKSEAGTFSYGYHSWVPLCYRATSFLLQFKPNHIYLYSTLYKAALL